MVVEKKNWYKSWFGNEYLTVYSHRDASEARQLVELIQHHIKLDPQQKILDLCCGQGRHVRELARSGYTVYGIDLSRTLLEVAKYKNSGASAYFIQADMRQLPASESFDLLLNLFTSFGYFESDEENEKVFRQFNRVLKPQGYFVFDYFNAPFITKNLVPYHKERINSLLVEQERFIEGSRVQKIIRLQREGEQSIFYESVQMYDYNQLQKMLKLARLEIIHVFGDYDGAAYSASSPRLIFIGKKTNTL